MPTPQKETIVQEMSEKFSRATGIYLADFTGIDVNTVVELRKKFFEADVEYKVVKNTLARRSMEKAGIDGMDPFLNGVNSYAISYDDPTTPIKVIKKLKKELDGKFDVKAAYFDGQVVPRDGVDALAELPSKEELLSQLMAMIQSPIVKLAQTLNASMSNVVGVLNALEEKKGEQA